MHGDRKAALGLPRARRRLVVYAAAAVAAVAALGPATGCGDDDEAKTFVGRAAPLEANLALVVEGDRVAAYLCDNGELAEWFSGELAEGRTELVSSDGDTRLLATVEDHEARAELRRAGRTAAVRAEPAKRNAGVYRAEVDDGNRRMVAGWVRLNDNAQTGAQILVDAGGAPIVGAAPPVDPAVVSEANGIVRFAGGLTAPVRRLDGVLETLNDG